ncbi:hypothetical protein D9757_014156 [Collybiopsis confluens]|uniref:Uncharacterized protein n=1 Tax=Collybiopsis confluens TaxID=2823264 RepID=A0A8H5CMJ9_9AGAR|nr:hypothetical protein D9757_014156 [Collybiopsis confluens]
MKWLEETAAAQHLEGVTSQNIAHILHADILPLVAERVIRLMDAAVREMGWVPREVFFFMRNPTDSMKKRSDDVESFLHGLASLDNLLPLMDQTTSTTGGHIHHRLFHQHLISTTPGVTDLSRATFRYTFKNEFTRHIFRAEILNKNWVQLKSLLDATSSGQSPFSRLMYGNVFELMAHLQVPTSSTVHICTAMIATSTAKGLKRWIVPKPKEVIKTIQFQGGPSPVMPLSNTAPYILPCGVYYRGSHSTPLIDACIFQTMHGVGLLGSHTIGSCPVLYFIQYTTMKRKEGDSAEGHKLVTDLYWAATRTAPKLSVRFLLIRDRDYGGNMVWKLPSFDFEHEVYHLALPIEGKDPFLVADSDRVSQKAAASLAAGDIPPQYLKDVRDTRMSRGA